MDIYKQTSYKQIIKDSVKEKKQQRSSFNLRKLAECIPVQYTYLSKVLNHEEAHLNEDHLFKACRLLDFQPSNLNLHCSCDKPRSLKITIGKDFLFAK